MRSREGAGRGGAGRGAGARGATGGEGAERGKGARDWPGRISYVEPEDGEGVPSFEMGFALFSNGISTELRLDYPDVEIKGALREIAYFPAGDC